MLLILFCTGAGAHAQSNDFHPLKITITVTWDLGLRLGVEYRPFTSVGFSADIGSSLFSLQGTFLLTADTFVVFYFFPPDNRFQLSARVGVPDARLIFIKPAEGEIAFGVSVEGGYHVADRLDAFLRVGGGVPFFWDGESFAQRKVSFPLGLWPDLSLGVRFPL